MRLSTGLGGADVHPPSVKANSKSALRGQKEALMRIKRSQVKKITLKAQMLRYLRKSCGLSAVQAGHRIGISGPSIMHYENGRMEIDSAKLEKLVQILHRKFSTSSEFFPGNGLSGSLYNHDSMATSSAGVK